MVLHFTCFVKLFTQIKCKRRLKIIFRLFIGKVAEQKKLRDLTNADIGKMTGYSKQTINAFMCGARQSEHVASAIAQALKIEM